MSYLNLLNTIAYSMDKPWTIIKTEKIYQLTQTSRGQKAPNSTVEDLRYMY